MAKKRLTGATFDASAKTIVHADFSDVTLAGIQLIVNVTDQIIIYNFADTAKGGTLATDTLTLEYDTTSMSDTDELMILVEDGVAAQAITGTVDLGATDNAVLDAIAASVAAIDTDATTIIGHVDGIEAALTAANSSLDAIEASVASSDASLTDIEAALETAGGLVVNLGANNDVVQPTHDNLNANANVQQNDTDVSTTNPLNAQIRLWDGDSFEVAIGNAVDGLTVNLGANNDVTVTGTVDLGATDNAVLDAIAASVAAIDTDTTTIIGHVDGIEALLGTIDADTGNIVTAVQLLDNAVFVDDADFSDGVSSGYGVMGVAENTPTTVTDGDMGMIGIDPSTRAVKIHDGGNTITVDGTITANLSATDNQVLDNIDADLTTIIGHVDGIETVLGTIDADTGGILTAVQIMDDWDNAASDGASISGDVAHDSPDAGEPVKIGFKAMALKANPTEVAANDRTNAIADVSGVQFVIGGHPNILSQSLQVTDADGAQTDTAIITAGANVAVVVTKISVMADNANTGDVSVRIGFGTANTPAADAAQVLLFHPGIAPGSGVVEGAGAGILGIGASGEDLRVTCEDPAGGSINIVVTYFTTDI